MKRRSHRLVLAVVLVLAAGTALAERYQVNWAPLNYVVTCSHDSCFPTHVHRQVERELRYLSARYRDLGFVPVKNFGPVRGQGPGEHVVVTDVKRPGYMSTSAACGPGSVTTINLEQDTHKILDSPYLPMYFSAHELFHAIQRGYAAFSPCVAAEPWVGEATATDLGLHLLRTHPQLKSIFPLKKRAGVEPERMMAELLNAAGGRPYDLPLDKRVKNTDPKVISDEGEWSLTGNRLHYQTNSFWRHLAETYYADSRDYLKRFFARKANGDWLRWLHDNLEQDLRVALGPIFTVFLADYASWHLTGLPGAAFTADEWYQNGFTRCYKVALSRQQQTKLETIEIQRTAGRCIEVTVDGLDAGQRVTVKPAILSAAEDHADQFNLGLVETRDQTGFNCARGLRSKDKDTRVYSLKNCFFLGNTTHVKFDPKDKAETWVRSWHVVPQYPKAGQILNTYVLTRVSPKPRSKPPLGDGGEVMKVQMVFTADFSKKTLAGTASGGQTVAHLNTESVHNAQEQVPRHNKQGGIAMPLVYPHAPRNVVIPKLPIEIAGDGDKRGIWLIRVTDVKVTNEGLYTESLAEGDSMSIHPVTDDGKSARPLRLGDTGSFKAFVSGKVGWLGVSTKTLATLTVDRFDRYSLVARLHGTVCDAPLDPRDRNGCVNPRTIDLEVSKGFAGVHLPGVKHVVEDTPATQQHRAWMSYLLNLHGGGAYAGGGPGGASGPGASGGGGAASPYKVSGPYSSTVHKVGTCECTCNDVYALTKLKGDLKSGRDKQNPEMLRFVMKLGGCMRACTPYYQVCKKQGQGQP